MCGRSLSYCLCPDKKLCVLLAKDSHYQIGGTNPLSVLGLLPS